VKVYPSLVIYVPVPTHMVKEEVSQKMGMRGRLKKIFGAEIL